jgi:hypothetical protein
MDAWQRFAAHSDPSAQSILLAAIPDCVRSAPRTGKSGTEYLDFVVFDGKEVG